MSKTARKTSAAEFPAVLRFKARLLPHPETAKAGSRMLLRVPGSVSSEFPAQDIAQIEGIINGQPFRAAMDADPDGGHWLRVSKAMWEGAGAAAGETVELAILGPEPEPQVPPDLKTALTGSKEAEALWKELTPECRRDYLRWVEAAKKEETRSRRVTRTVEQLAEGKRRPCCVNFYEYMLSRVQEA